MIKQTWNINEDEKLRILNLHESATKNLYLSEQTSVVVGTETKTENKNFPTTKSISNRQMPNIKQPIRRIYINSIRYKLIKKWKTIFSIKIENKHHKILILLQTLKT